MIFDVKKAVCAYKKLISGEYASNEARIVEEAGKVADREAVSIQSNYNTKQAPTVFDTQ